MSDVKSNQFDLKKIAEDVSKRPAPSSCETIAQLLSNLPVKSWIHRQLHTTKSRTSILGSYFRDIQKSCSQYNMDVAHSLCHLIPLSLQ